MSFFERLSIEINTKNCDMFAVSRGSIVGGRLPELLSVFALIKAPQHYKDLFVCKVQSAAKAPILPQTKTEKLIFDDCFAVYVDKVLHQKKRGYFLVRKDLERDELEILTRAAIYSNIEQVKKTEKYYCDLLEVARSTFRDKYENTLELFCRVIDNELHKIEKQARELI